MLNTEYNGTHSWLLEYISKCRLGEIIVGHEIQMEFDRILEDFNDPSIKVEFEDAHKRIKFIETKCKHSEAPFAGKPFILELFQKAFIESIYIFKVFDEELGRYVRLIQEVLFMVARKNGKALALDTPIPTPNGWRTMGDLSKGDFVFDDKGNPTKIVRISDIFIGHKCYEVTFEDGEVIVADADHIWTVMTKNSRRAYNRDCKRTTGVYRPIYRENEGYYNTTTSEMANDFMRYRKDGKGIEYKYRVPMNQPVQYTEKDLSIHPYMLGVWLGDGESSGARISVSKADLDETVSLIKSTGAKIVSIRDDKKCKRVRVTQENSCLQTDLRKLNLINNKHIPDSYMYSSVEQRTELLKGLMDTDGYVAKDGQCQFVQADYALVMQFSELLASLGIKHSVKEKTIQCNGKTCTAYSVLFHVDKTTSCFKLKRKHDRLKDNLAPRMLNKSIINIKEVESVPTKCIGVDAPSSLYLAGKRMTVTHNTPLIGAMCLSEWFCGDMGLKILCSSNDYEQADLMFQAINNMREESPSLERVTRKNIKGIYFGNPRKPKKKGKFSYQNKGSIRKISAKTGAKEGRNIGVGAVDEVHELQDNSSIMPIRQALSTQDEPLYLELTTDGFVNDGYLDERLSDARKVLKRDMDRRRWRIWLFTQDNEQEIWQDEKSWYKSNPGLGVIKKWSFLRQMVEEAKTSKKTRAFVLAKDFNIKQNNAAAWLSAEQIENEETFDLGEFRNGFAIGAVDLSKSGDLTNARIMLMKKDSPKNTSIPTISYQSPKLTTCLWKMWITLKNG